MKIVRQNNKPVHILEIIMSLINLFVNEDYTIERLLVFFFDVQSECAGYPATGCWNHVVIW